MKKLIKGIINFRQVALAEYRQKFAQLAVRHAPDALLIACCDSRVVPNVFASSDPGDLFVVRNIGNLVPPSPPDGRHDSAVASAIEFSLGSLNVADIIVCGHSECGAMQALLNKDSCLTSPLPALEAWLTYAATSYTRFKALSDKAEALLPPCNQLSRINVLQQLDNLKTYPIVHARLKNKTLRLHGWWFDLATADVYYYNFVHEKFLVIDEKEAQIILS